MENYIKLFESDKKIDEWLLKTLWDELYWYLFFLIKNIKEKSIIDISILNHITDDATISWRLLPKIEMYWIWKYYHNKWYIHPDIAYKWETIDNDVIDLFRDIALWPNQ